MAYQPELEKLQQRYESDPARNFAQLAEAYRRDRRLDEALNLLHMHLEERPNYVSGLIVLGRCLLDRQDDAEARETFERVLAVDAQHIIALKALADLAQRAGDSSTARKWLTRLIEVDPMNEEAHEALEALEAAPAPAPTEPADAPPLEPAAVGEVPTEALAGLEPTSLDEPPETPPSPEITPTVIESAVQLEPAHDAATDLGTGDAPPADPGLEIERASAAYDAPPTDDEALEVEPSDPATIPPTTKIPAVRLEEAAAEDAAEIRASRGVSEEELAEPAAEEPTEDLDIQPFDTTLGWGTGERRSRKITRADIVEAEQAHEDVEPPAHELPGLEHADVPDLSGATEDVEPPEPIVTNFTEPDEPVEPLDGLTATSTTDELEEPPAPLPGLEPPLVETVDTLADTTPFESVPPPADLAGGEEEEAVAMEEPAAESAESTDTVEATADAVVDDASPGLVLEETVAEAFPAVVPPELETPDVPVEEPVGQQPWDEAPAADAASEPAEFAPAEEETAPLAEPDQEPAESRGSLAGLPVFLPEETSGESGAAEPEPVVTETMAEVYARQGLVSEAREVYRRLLEARPGDARLAARLAELEKGPAASPDARRYAASETGGESARQLLIDVLSSRVVTQAAEEPPVEEAVDEPIAQAGPAPPVEPATPMDEAFDEEPLEPRGAPTMPAADDVSLASIFGEAPGPARTQKEAPQDLESTPEAPKESGFSFDEFFGGTKPADPTEEPRATRDTLADDEGDEAFRNWLKGLKS